MTTDHLTELPGYAERAEVAKADAWEAHLRLRLACIDAHKSGLSAPKIADAIGVSRQTVYNYINAREEA